MLNSEYKIEKLSNGITVLMEEIPTLRSACVGILVGVGSKNETENNAGISHFIEHMAFKGTAKRSSFDIAHEMDAIGGRINAHTTKEYTCYYAVVLDTHVDLAIDILADMYLNSVYNENELNTERNVILEEINMYEDTPDEKIHDLATQNIWDGHALSNPVIGNISSVKKINREMIFKFIKEYYTPNNTFIAVAGNINAKRIKALIEDRFKNFRGKKIDYQDEAPHIKPGIKIYKKDTEQTHICLTAKGVSYENEDRFAMSLLSSVIGGSMSSRLFQKVREQKGLVYSIYSYPTFYRKGGLFTIYVGTNVKNAQQVMDITLGEFKDIKLNSITDQELSRVKEQLKGHMVLNMEESSSRMNWLMKSHYYYNEVKTLEEVIKKIDVVTADDLQRLANQFFITEDLQLTAIGDFSKSNFFKNIEC